MKRQLSFYKELEESEQKILDDEVEKRKNAMLSYSKMTYFGSRANPEERNISKNMYEIIKGMNMGNMASYSKIPEYYMKMFLGYLMQVSKAMSHAHKNNLVHGKYDLSKIIV